MKESSFGVTVNQSHERKRERDRKHPAMPFMTTHCQLVVDVFGFLVFLLQAVSSMFQHDEEC